MNVSDRSCLLMNEWRNIGRSIVVNKSCIIVVLDLSKYYALRHTKPIVYHKMKKTPSGEIHSHPSKKRDNDDFSTPHPPTLRSCPKESKTTCTPFLHTSTRFSLSKFDCAMSPRRPQLWYNRNSYVWYLKEREIMRTHIWQTTAHPNNNNIQHLPP